MSPDVMALTGRDLLPLKFWNPTDPYPKAAAALHALSKETTLGHLRMLTSLQDRIRQDPRLHHLPISTIAYHHVDCLGAASKLGWVASSHFRNLTAMDGALSKIGKLALNWHGSIRLKFCPEWTQALKAWDLFAKEHQPINLSAATANDVAKAVSLHPNREIQAALILLWLLAGRKGDVLNLRAGSDPNRQAVSINKEGRILAFIMEGKGVKARQGMYHVASFCPLEWRPTLEAFLNSRKGEQFLFRPSLKKSNELNRALQAVDPTLTCRSLRRGATRAMAADPQVTPETIMTLTGHKNKETLYRYLGWNKTNENEHSAAQKAASNNLAPSPQWAPQF